MPDSETTGASPMPGTGADVNASGSTERLLEEMHRRGKRWRLLGLVWLVVLVVVVVAIPASEGRNVARLVAVVLGPAYTYLGVVWLRLIPQARAALGVAPMPCRLQTKIRYGYAFRRYLNAQLWWSDRSDFPLARFGEVQLRALPRFLDVKLAPAVVYGAPAKGAVVIVICQQGILVGRIKKSNYQPAADPAHAAAT